ncbi:hypothetical protein BKI51_07205 [Alphaproteobacteria bacterium AO1-B]|nr:hypothetical protein BKI51_07205 [Alphaproteobacteria bacterium AO1-B]
MLRPGNVIWNQCWLSFHALIHAPANVPARVQATRKRVLYRFPYRVCVRNPDTGRAQIRTRTARRSGHGIGLGPLSGIRTGALGRKGDKIGFKAQLVTGCLLLIGLRVAPLFPADQAAPFQVLQMQVQGGAAHFAVPRQGFLFGKTAVIRIVPVTQVPKNDLGRRFQAALQDRPVGRLVAHGRDHLPRSDGNRSRSSGGRAMPWSRAVFCAMRTRAQAADSLRSVCSPLNNLETRFGGTPASRDQRYPVRSSTVSTRLIHWRKSRGSGRSMIHSRGLKW